MSSSGPHFGLASLEARKVACERASREVREQLQASCDALLRDTNELRAQANGLRNALAVARHAKAGLQADLDATERHDRDRAVASAATPRSNVGLPPTSLVPLAARRVSDEDPLDNAEADALRRNLAVREAQLSALRQRHAASRSRLQVATTLLSTAMATRQGLSTELMALRSAAQRAEAASTSEQVAEAHAITTEYAVVEKDVVGQQDELADLVGERRAMIAHLVDGWKGRGAALADAWTKTSRQDLSPQDARYLSGVVAGLLARRERCATLIENSAAEWEALHSYGGVLKARVAEAGLRCQRRAFDLELASQAAASKAAHRVAS